MSKENFFPIPNLGEFNVCNDMASHAHIMASAVQELFPDVKYAIGPAIEDGFFYDFQTETPFTEKDLEKIEKRMRGIVRRNDPFQLTMKPIAEAKREFAERNDNFKVEIMEGIEDPEVSIYQHGKFVDLCRGPHLPSTGRLRAFKLLKVAGSYWRGDSDRESLQRIYGTSWDSQEELEITDVSPCCLVFSCITPM